MLYCLGSSNMLSLPFPLMLAKSLHQVEIQLVLPNIPKPSFAMRVHHTYLWIEQDPSSKLSSVQAIKIALSKYVWSISVKKISFIRSCDVEEIKATNSIIKVHITSGNIKWRSFALRFCASNPKSTWQPLLPSAKGLSFTLCLLLYARVKVIFTFPFFILSFGKHLVLGWSWYIYPTGCTLAWTIIVDITQRWILGEATL